MKPDRPLYWHQGLFLQPQHFQIADRVSHSLLIPFQEHLMPFFWGASEVTIHKASLGTGAFQLSGGTFLFSDGSYVSLPGNAVIESRNFEQDWAEGGKLFTVYVGLKKWNPAGENVTQLEPGEPLTRVSTRFITRTGDDTTVDLHGGGPSSEVRRLDFLLKLFWESEIDSMGDYLLIPVAQLEKTREGIDLAQQFIPPVLTIGSSETLFAIVREIRDQLASRSRQLEGFKRQRGVQTAEFGSRDVVYLLALRTLNRYVPLLFHICETRKVHPWTIYGSLRQLIGELSSFSETVTVIGELTSDGSSLLPEYDHRNLWGCFNAAHLLILRLLDEITAGPEYVLPLLYDGTYFATEMKPSHFSGGNRYFVVLKTEKDPNEVLQSLSAGAKLCSRERLPLLIARALPGVALKHLPNPPQELPRRAFSYYFSVDVHSELWTLVEKGNNIALYWDSAPQDLEVEIMIVEKS